MSRILIVDDSEILSTMLQELLSAHGFEVSAAMDAEGAFQDVRRRVPDLILLDIVLPDVGGVELCKFFRSRPETRHVPIIMITGTANQTDQKVRGLQAGADDYILKPFEPEELLERVQAVLRRVSRMEPPSSTPVSLAAEPILASVEPLLTPSRSVHEVAFCALFSPLELSLDAVDSSGVPLIFLVSLLAIFCLGLALAPGTPIKIIPACLVLLIAWGFLVSVLVMASSILGISMTWMEGSSVLSLAYLPVLLKWVGACVFSAWTALSPLLYTASPVLFLGPSSVLMSRLDLFEIWSVVLLIIFMRKRTGAVRQRSWIAALLVGLAAALVFSGLQWMGTHS